MRWNTGVMIVLLSAGSMTVYAAGKRAELDGVWILLRTGIAKPQLTAVGEKARAGYDYQKDDPDFQCKPASFTRIMHTPSPPIEVLQRQDHVEINYEFMDVRRRVPLQKGLWRENRKPGDLTVKSAPYTV